MPSLRERKRAQSKAAIQAEALRLFRRQGYAATTVEQIATAAGVSASTFFRYFQTKEAAILHDTFDPALMAAFRAQPADLTVVQALRRTLAAVFRGAPANQLDQAWRRAELIRSVPELRAALADELARNIELFASLIAERTSRQASELAVRNLAGAVIGVVMAVMLDSYRTADDYLQSLDAALEQLEQGLGL